MPLIDVVDSTWLAARPGVVAPALAEPANWRRWWPGLALVIEERRGELGMRWTVRAVAGTRLAGSAEVWLEPVFDGVVAHFFLRLDPVAGRSVSRRRAGRVGHVYRCRTKRGFWALGDELDQSRLTRLTSTATGSRF